MAGIGTKEFLEENHIYHGDSRVLLKNIRPDSIALSIWSPPYFVGNHTKKICLLRTGKIYCEWLSSDISQS